MLRFTEAEYNRIHELTFGTPGYTGYKPTVQESPNGDGVFDTEKKYAHVAAKYRPCGELMIYFDRALREARRVHTELQLPKHLNPATFESCLRILDYPADAGSAEHTDFDLFTIQLYRDHPEGFRRTGGAFFNPETENADELVSPGIHFGEMAEVAGLRKATPHRVDALPYRQRSIVFFALPDADAVLVRAGDWLKERYTRSRR